MILENSLSNGKCIKIEMRLHKYLEPLGLYDKWSMYVHIIPYMAYTLTVGL